MIQGTKGGRMAHTMTPDFLFAFLNFKLLKAEKMI